MWWMKQWQPSNWSLSSTKVTPWQFYFVSYCEFLVFGWSKLWTGALDQGFFAHWVGFDLCEGDLEPTGLSVGSFCLAYYFLRTTCVQWSWHFWGSLIILYFYIFGDSKNRPSSQNETKNRIRFTKFLPNFCRMRVLFTTKNSTVCPKLFGLLTWSQNG